MMLCLLVGVPNTVFVMSPVSVDVPHPRLLRAYNHNYPIVVFTVVSFLHMGIRVGGLIQNVKKGRLLLILGIRITP